eukprot:scaffold90357_cov24-Phaeocystis_antarctica.AAC.1
MDICNAARQQKWGRHGVIRCGQAQAAEQWAAFLSEMELAVNDLGLPIPPHAPRKPPHTRGFGTLPRASVYVSVAETASLGRLFFVACGRLPCPR